MAKPAGLGKRLRWRLEAVGLGAVMALFAALPLDRASAAGGWLLRRLGPLLPAQRTARANLGLALPELDRPAQDRLLAAMWENLGRTAAEYPHLGDLLREAGARLELDLHPDFTALCARGGSAILASAHFANWEVMPLAASALAGLDTVAVVRQPNNPLVRDRLEGWRAVMGGRRVAKGREGTRETLGALQAGKTLGLLADQKLNEGIEARFFGLPAMTPAAPAQLALRFGVPLFPCRIERLGGARFRLTVAAPLAVPETPERAAAIAEMTQALNDRLEAWIRHKPEDWLWLHRRWPRQLYRRD